MKVKNNINELIIDGVKPEQLKNFLSLTDWDNNHFLKSKFILYFILQWTRFFIKLIKKIFNNQNNRKN